MIVVVDVVLFAASLFSTLDSSAGLLEHISFLLLWMVWMMCCGVDVCQITRLFCCSSLLQGELANKFFCLKYVESYDVVTAFMQEIDLAKSRRAEALGMLVARFVTQTGLNLSCISLHNG